MRSPFERIENAIEYLEEQIESSKKAIRAMAPPVTKPGADKDLHKLHETVWKLKDNILDGDTPKSDLPDAE